MTFLQKFLTFLFFLSAMSCQKTGPNPDQNIKKDFEVSGKIFRFSKEFKTFDILKETAVDPTSNEGRSRYTVSFNEDTQFIETLKTNNFKELSEPVLAYVYNLDKGKLDQANAEKAKNGEEFLALHVIILKEGEDTSDYPIRNNSVLGKITPLGDEPNFRKASIDLNGKSVPFRLRGPRAQIEINKAIEPKDIASDGWETTLQVKSLNGQWVAKKVEVTRRPDPRDIDNPNLPRVLVIGDSISMNYHEAAKKSLEGVANYYRNDGNAGPSDRGTLCIDLWVGDVKQPGLHWDVIQFNFGLHDLKQMFDESSQTYGEYQLPLEEYKNNLETVIQKLKKTGAKLVWCTTTPVPNSSVGKWGDKVMGRRKDEDLVFNKAALDVIQQHPEIQVSDINTFIRENKAFDDWRKGKDVHFWGRDLQELVGKAVADNLKKALAGK